MKLQIVRIITDISIIVYMVVNILYIRRLEREIGALKSWIEAFWKIDLNKIAKIAEERKNKNEPNN